jgi:segregation and condensation protein B
MTVRSQLEAAIEAVLFASNDPVTVARLYEVFPGDASEGVDAAFEVVCERYRSSEDSRGVFVEEVAGGHRLVTRPQLHGYLRKYFDVTGHNRLSMASLETLAIVAYRQPVTGPEIQEMRGVNSSGVLKTLLDRRLIRISGRKQVVGKPFIYRTTREFLMHFGLKGIGDLPPLEEFEESFGALEVELDLGGRDELEPLEVDTEDVEVSYADVTEEE